MKALLCRILDHRWKPARVFTFDRPITLQPGESINLEAKISDFKPVMRCTRCHREIPIAEEAST